MFKLQLLRKKKRSNILWILQQNKSKIDSNQFATDEEKSTAKHKIDQIINKAYAAIKKQKVIVK